MVAYAERTSDDEPGPPEPFLRECQSVSCPTNGTHLTGLALQGVVLDGIELQGTAVTLNFAFATDYLVITNEGTKLKEKNEFKIKPSVDVVVPKGQELKSILHVELSDSPRDGQIYVDPQGKRWLVVSIRDQGRIEFYDFDGNKKKEISIPFSVHAKSFRFSNGKLYVLGAPINNEKTPGKNHDMITAIDLSSQLKPESDIKITSSFERYCEGAHPDVLNISSDGKSQRLCVGGRPSALAVSPDGKTILVVNEEDNRTGTVGVVSTNPFAKTQENIIFPNENALHDVVFAPNGKRAFVLAENMTVFLLDNSSNGWRLNEKVIDLGGLEQEWKGEGFGLAISRSGQELYVTRGTRKPEKPQDNQLIVVDLRYLDCYLSNSRMAAGDFGRLQQCPKALDGLQVQRYNVGLRPWGVALSSDGCQILVASSFSDQIDVVRLTDGNIAKFPIKSQPRLLSLWSDEGLSSSTMCEERTWNFTAAVKDLGHQKDFGCGEHHVNVHVLSYWNDTPGGIGLLPMLEQEIDALIGKIPEETPSDQKGFLANIKQILDTSSAHYGLIRAATGVKAHLSYHFQTTSKQCPQDKVGWVREASDYIEKILAVAQSLLVETWS
jgi:DNA-binding beta-propeller fold protein YncE